MRLTLHRASSDNNPDSSPGPDRVLSVVMILGIGFLLMVSLLLSTALAAAGKVFEGILPAPESVLHMLNFALSFGVITTPAVPKDMRNR